MQVHVNGQKQKIEQPAGQSVSLFGLLEQLGYRGETFAVALNGDFVARASYSKTHLADGDVLDIVAPVVGG